MSEADKAILTDDLPLHLSPEALKQRIRALVRRYTNRRSPQIARAVVQHSEALSLHPALRDQPDQLKAFCQLKWHWRMLAAQCPALAAA
ncbi:MAG: ATP dependent RNA helicase [Thiohalocapsa sp.]